MPRRISSSAQARLGLLTIEPVSGYDLGLNLRSSVGHIASEARDKSAPVSGNSSLHASLLRRLKSKAVNPTVAFTRLRKRAETNSSNGAPRFQKLKFLVTSCCSSYSFDTDSGVRPHRIHGAHGCSNTVLYINISKVSSMTKSPRTEVGRKPFFGVTPARYGQLEMEAHLRGEEETLASLRKLDRQQKKSFTALTETR